MVLNLENNNFYENCSGLKNFMINFSKLKELKSFELSLKNNYLSEMIFDLFYHMRQLEILKLDLSYNNYTTNKQY